MDDLHLEDAFDDLVARIDDTVDVAALRRRISRSRRRRTVAGASTIGLCAAGLAGVTVVIQRSPERAPAAASAPSAAPPTTVLLPACPAVPTTNKPQRPTDDKAAASKEAERATAGQANVHGVKGIGSVTAVSPGRVDVAVTAGDVTPGPRATVTLLLDQHTSWGTPTGMSTTPSALVAGESIGFAGLASSDGTYQALLIDVTVGHDDAKATDAGGPKGSAADHSTRPQPDPHIRKSTATIVAADASTITVTVHDGPDAGQQRTLSLAGTMFSVAGVACRAAAPLAAGTEIGIVYTDGTAGSMARAITLG